MSRFLTFAELQQAEEQLPGERQVVYLLAALGDWPTCNLQEPDEFVAELHAELGEPLTYEALSRYSQASDDLWKREALGSLLLLFDDETFRPNMSQELEILLDELTARVRTSLKK